MIRTLLKTSHFAAVGLSSALLCGPALAQSSNSAASFQGPYIGLSPIYGWAKSSITLSRPGFADVSGSKDISGPAISALAGYDWRVGAGTVFGITGDIGLAKLGDSKTAPAGTLRARLGQVVVPNALFYATGGGTFTQQSLSGTLGGVAYDVSQFKSGWVFGGGIETNTAIGTQPIRFGVEVLRHQLSTFAFDAGTRHVAIDNKVWTLGVRAAIPLGGGR
jgi:opacity protein-like surface antigen